MLKKITWTKKKFNWFFSYIVLSSIVNVGVILFFIGKNYEFRVIDNFDGIILAILSILGTFIAFTAINMYSIFNARIVEETHKLEETRKQLNENIENIENKIENHYKAFSALEDRIDDYNFNDDILNIIRSSVLLLEKTRAIYSLTERIEIIKKNIDETDSIDEREKLEQKLLLLKYTIKQNLKPQYHKIEEKGNDIFKGIFDNFKALFDEEPEV